MRRVKIVCTIGPTSRETDVLRQIISSGMDVARLNLSHGDHEYHRGTIERIRALSEELDKPVAILADLQGPKLRVGKMQEGGVPLIEGERLILTNEKVVGKPGRIPIQYKRLPSRIQPGERILFDDGLLECVVLSTNGVDEIEVEIVIGGTLNNNKGMNLPDASLDIPALTKKDRIDVEFALEHQVDWVALSFVRTADEVIELKTLMREKSLLGNTIPVISKIEKPEAVDNIDAIIQASDAIMVARGDLGIETSPEAVPMVQKMIITKCHLAAKPVITATQMLDSMIRNPRPTRAEASDVANAVLDRTDALMLSGETASGSYPVQSVETMVKIAEETERVRATIETNRLHHEHAHSSTVTEAVCRATVQTSRDIKARAIITPTMSGTTAKRISNLRPSTNIVAITPSPIVQRQLCLYWGVIPLVTKRQMSTDDVVSDAIRIVKEHGYVTQGDKVVVTAGLVGDIPGTTNLMMVRSIERILVRGTGIGQRKVAGRIKRIGLPVADDVMVGPDDILLTDRIDRTCVRLLRGAGGVLTRETRLDNYAAVAALELGIPAVIGVKGDFEALLDGTQIVLDPISGEVTQ